MKKTLDYTRCEEHLRKCLISHKKAYEKFSKLHEAVDVAQLHLDVVKGEWPRASLEFRSASEDYRNAESTLNKLKGKSR